MKKLKRARRSSVIQGNRGSLSLIKPALIWRSLHTQPYIFTHPKHLVADPSTPNAITCSYLQVTPKMVPPGTSKNEEPVRSNFMLVRLLSRTTGGMKTWNTGIAMRLKCRHNFCSEHMKQNTETRWKNGVTGNNVVFLSFSLLCFCFIKWSTHKKKVIETPKHN